MASQRPLDNKRVDFQMRVKSGEWKRHTQNTHKSRPEWARAAMSAPSTMIGWILLETHSVNSIEALVSNGRVNAEDNRRKQKNFSKKAKKLRFFGDFHIAP